MTDYKKVAQSWLGADFDEDTRSAVRAMLSGAESELEDAFYKNLEFGTGGLRGIMGVGTNRMNVYTVAMATQGLANYILSHKEAGKKPSVCISYDSRNHSREFAHITADVLSANGIDVFIFDDIRPTPELSYSIRSKKAIAGVMVTASHNPKEYNGYKVFWSDGGQITSPVDKEIVEEVRKITSPSMVKRKCDGECGHISIMGEEMDKAYLHDILSLALSPEIDAKHSDLKIVYTPLHGCGVKMVPAALNALGFNNIIHVPQQDISDGNFPTVASPNPEESSALKMAIEKADECGADLVIATDPDADRMGIAVRDQSGKMVLFNGNQTASMMVFYILSRLKERGELTEGKYCVKTIVTTELIKQICDSFSIPLYDVLTGFKYIAEVVKRKEEGGEFICGAEESYGFNAGQFVRDKDAQTASIFIAETVSWAAEQGLTPYDLMQKIYSIYGYRKEALVSLVRKGISGAEEIKSIMRDLRTNPPSQMCGSAVCKVVDYLLPEKTGLPKSDVLQFFNEDGDVVSVRPSGTEPKIKFYFGAGGDDADKKIEMLKEQFAR